RFQGIRSRLLTRINHNVMFSSVSCCCCTFSGSTDHKFYFTHMKLLLNYCIILLFSCPYRKSRLPLFINREKRESERPPLFSLDFSKTGFLSYKVNGIGLGSEQTTGPLIHTINSNFWFSP